MKHQRDQVPWPAPVFCSIVLVSTPPERGSESEYLAGPLKNAVFFAGRLFFMLDSMEAEGGTLEVVCLGL